MFQLLATKNQRPARHQTVDVIAVADSKGYCGHRGLWSAFTQLLSDTTNTGVILELTVGEPKKTYRRDVRPEITKIKTEISRLKHSQCLIYNHKD